MRRVGTMLGSAVLVSGTLIGGLSSAAPAVAGLYHPPVTGAHHIFQDTVATFNWSGYAVESQTTAFTQATGTWTEPTAVSCSHRGNTYSSFWIGLDGYSSNSVEQLGTDVDCSSGRAQYYAWYEMYPNPSHLISHTVRPGDTLTATVQNTAPGSYTLTLADAQKGWTFTTTRNGTYADASAEWVAEAPSLCSAYSCTVAQLTNFGTVNFSGAQATSGGAQAAASSFTANGGPHEMVMVNSSDTLVRAEPGGLSTTDTGSGSSSGFTDTWYHS